MNFVSTLVLIILITVSAFSAIFIKYQNRTLNIEVSKNEKILFETSEKYRELLRQKINLTDSKLQKNSLGGALGMSLPSKERILIMNLNH
jgi:cell division protein FtsL